MGYWAWPGKDWTLANYCGQRFFHAAPEPVFEIHADAEVVLIMRIGELLVSAGRITPAQLDETLKGQAIFGGRFGTNLIEMGYLDEHDLAHFLSKKTGVPYAAPEQLMDIPHQVIRLIPEETVRKHRVMPLALNNRKLTLAMVDPADFAVIDEISFATGYIVVPVIAPELRMVSAMEKHYRIKREMRYISVEGGSRSRARQTQMQPPATPRKTAAAPPPPPAPTREAWLAPEEAEVLELPMLDELDCLGLGEPEALPAPPAETIQYLKPEKDYSLEGVIEGLAQAEDRDSIADLITGHLAREFDRVAIFLLKGGKATGWTAQAGKKPVAGFETLEIPLAEPSVLKIVEETKSFHLGPLPALPRNNQLVTALGGGTSGNNLLVPLLMMGRVVAVLYVEGKNPLGGRVPELQKLLSKASMSFEILILKNKILMS